MAIFKKKLTPGEVVELYFQTKEDVTALGTLVSSESPAVKEAAVQGVVDIKKDIAKLAKEIKRTRNNSEAELNEHEDMLLGRISDEEYQEGFEAYEEEIVMMDFVEEDAQELLEIVEDYSKVLEGKLNKARSFQEGQPKNYTEYVDYTKQAISLARGREHAREQRGKISVNDSLTAAGMVASSVVAASNPVLGSTLMAANFVAGQRRKEHEQEGNQPQH